MSLSLTLGLTLGSAVAGGGGPVPPEVTATITGAPPAAVIGEPYSHTFTVTFSDSVNRPSALDSEAAGLLSAHGIAYDPDTHTLSSDEVLA